MSRVSVAAEAGPEAETARPRAAAVETRPLKPEAEDRLPLFRDEQLIRGGQVLLMSLDPIAAFFGSRWTLQAQRVEAYLDRWLKAELAADGAFLQISPSDVLVSLPGLSREDAQLECLRLLRHILQQFLGSSAKALDGLHHVRAILGDQVEAVPIAAEDLAARESVALARREEAEALARALESFVPSHGRKVRVACELEPVVQIATGATIGVRFGQCITAAGEAAPLSTAAVADFAGVDRQRADWASVVQGLAQLQAQALTPPALVVSMSYATLSSQRGRSEMLDLIQRAQRHAAHGVICEVSGVEGAPHAQLQEAVSLVRAHALFVVGKIDNPALTVWSQLKGVGFRGIALDCPAVDGAAQLLGWARSSVARARRAASSVLIYGVPAPDLLQTLDGVGATHATVRGRGPGSAAV